MNKDKIMGLSEADIDYMQEIDAKVTAANQTCRVALDHHGATMQHLSGERDQFWVSIRDRFELAPNQQFVIKNVDGFWQVLLNEEATEVDVPHDD